MLQKVHGDTSAWIRLPPVNIIYTVECASAKFSETQLHSGDIQWAALSL